MGYKVILLTVQANCVTKKTPETLEVFPKETFTSLMVILQSSKVLIYAWTVHIKLYELAISLHLFFHSFLRECDITYWLKTFYLVEHQLDSFFAPKVDRSFCPVIFT